MVTSPEDLLAIYHEDCEFCRYQDNLRWSRFRTAATVEGAVLAVLFAMPGLSGITLWQTRIVIIFGFALVLVICLLALKDQWDARVHLERMMEFEKARAPFPERRVSPILRGSCLMGAAVLIINVFNLLVATDRWSY